MAYQSDFRRYELKYILNGDQLSAVMDAMNGRMEPDAFGSSDIRNVYYDTDDFLLAIRSISHPDYKEKLRVRKYSGNPEDPVFVEIKKKCDSVSYKRRISLPESDASKWLEGERVQGTDSQIGREIEAFRDRYPTLHPVMSLCYDRVSYRSAIGEDLRLTLDTNVRARMDHVGFESTYGERLIPEGSAIMELKTGTAIPLWMVRVLTDGGIRQGSFSKYGTAYKKLVMGMA